MQTYHGNYVDVGSLPGSLTIKNAWITVNTITGIITDITTSNPSDLTNIIHLPSTHLLCPGFIDTHVHAAQIQYQGTGTDLPLMQWLHKYAFPSEKRLTNDLQLSKTVYTNLVTNLCNNGTTTCLYFGVMGVESTKILVDVCKQLGQRAIIGKVNMNRLAPDDYCETTEKSITDTLDFINYCQQDPQQDPNKIPLVAPCITPRFVPSCTEDLLAGLGEIAQTTGVRIQSHAVESVDCLNTVEALHPGQDEVELLNKHGLLTDKSIMAHCVHVSASHCDTFLKNGVGISHCPLSNFYFAGGALRTKALMDKGIKMGLGTDVAGGYSHTMLNSIRHCVTTHLAICSADVNEIGSDKCHGVAPGSGDPVERSSFNYKHAVWLATAGGANVLGLEDVTGQLMKGFQFDALLIDLTLFEDVLKEDTLLTTFEKFVHLGDDRHIEKVWIQGRRVK